MTDYLKSEEFDAKVSELPQSDEGIAICYIDGSCSRYYIRNNAKSICTFAMMFETKNVTFTDIFDRLILSTFGGFLMTVPDQKMLGEYQNAIIPMQMRRRRIVQMEFASCEDYKDEFVQINVEEWEKKYLEASQSEQCPEDEEGACDDDFVAPDKPTGNSKWVLISECNREIVSEIFKSYDEAYDKMLNEVIKYGKLTEDEDISELKRGFADNGTFGITSYTAYANSGCDFDWAIIEVPMD